jgi:hypothetical protein
MRDCTYLYGPDATDRPVEPRDGEVAVVPRPLTRDHLFAPIHVSRPFQRLVGVKVLVVVEVEQEEGVRARVAGL